MSDTETPPVETDGTVEVEGTTDTLSDAQIIARRSADISADEATNNEHVKVFVLPPGAKPTVANGYAHEANYAATRQYAISQGLRPTGDVRLVSIKQHGPGTGNERSWALTYAVAVKPVERVNDWLDLVDPARAVVTDNETDETGTHVPNTTGEAPAGSDDKPGE